MKRDFQEWIAEDIAYFLFDDFETIGVPQFFRYKHTRFFNLNGIFSSLIFFSFGCW